MVTTFALFPAPLFVIEISHTGRPDDKNEDTFIFSLPGEIEVTQQEAWHCKEST